MNSPDSQQAVTNSNRRYIQTKEKNCALLDGQRKIFNQWRSIKKHHSKVHGRLQVIRSQKPVVILLGIPLSGKTKIIASPKIQVATSPQVPRGFEDVNKTIPSKIKNSYKNENDAKILSVLNRIQHPSPVMPFIASIHATPILLIRQK